MHTWYYGHMPPPKAILQHSQQLRNNQTIGKLGYSIQSLPEITKLYPWVYNVNYTWIYNVKVSWESLVRGNIMSEYTHIQGLDEIQGWHTSIWRSIRRADPPSLIWPSKMADWKMINRMIKKATIIMGKITSRTNKKKIFAEIFGG